MHITVHGVYSCRLIVKPFANSETYQSTINSLKIYTQQIHKCMQNLHIDKRYNMQKSNSDVNLMYYIND